MERPRLLSGHTKAHGELRKDAQSPKKLVLRILSQESTQAALCGAHVPAMKPTCLVAAAPALLQGASRRQEEAVMAMGREQTEEPEEHRVCRVPSQARCSLALSDSQSPLAPSQGGHFQKKVTVQPAWLSG